MSIALFSQKTNPNTDHHNISVETSSVSFPLGYPLAIDAESTNLHSITMPHQHKSTIISFLQFTAYSNLDACIALTFITLFTLSILELCLKLFVNLSQAIAGSPSVWFSLSFLFRWKMPILYKLLYLNHPHY